MISEEACCDLGTVEGTDFAVQQIRAIGEAVLSAAPFTRDALITIAMAEWQQRNLYERSRRRLELAACGAGVAGIAAYEAARETAFSMVMAGAAADLNKTVAKTPNRQERRRTTKTGKRLQ